MSAAFASARDKLRNIKPPSRGVVIFTTVVGTFFGLVYRDRRLTEQVHEELRLRAAELANQPLASTDRVRKVAVYLMRPHPDDSIRTSRQIFAKYIKPVFDAAALDYDLVEAFEPGAVARHTQQTLAKKQRYVRWTDEDRMRALVLSTAQDDLQYFYRMQDYDAYVALGRKPFEEVLVGYQAGLQQARDEAVEDGVVAAATAQATAGRSTSWLRSLFGGSSSSPAPAESSSTAAEHPIDTISGYPLSLPAVAYLPLFTLKGLANFPKKMYRWFNKHEQARLLGTMALQIAEAAGTRPLSPVDFELGVTEFGMQLAAKAAGKPVGHADDSEPTLVQAYADFWPAPVPAHVKVAEAVQKLSAKYEAEQKAAVDAVSAQSILSSAGTQQLQAPHLATAPAAPAAEGAAEAGVESGFAPEPATPEEPVFEDPYAKNDEAKAAAAAKEDKAKAAEDRETERERKEKTKSELLKRYFVPKAVDARELVEVRAPIYDFGDKSLVV
ncbi:mitochondrial import inner membrane translocase subunit tim54 [Blastocladiella emersonii ATCC 22665]|nr:mitochondrial import inner membrane translocase subunit tim54 [Blastocladiella emersonii ATCC 22665]